MSELDPPKELRHLDITDNERVERFRRAGYGGSVSDALSTVGVRDTVFSSQFKPLRQGMQLAGRAIPVKAHSQADLTDFPEEKRKLEARWEADGGHPQKRLMRCVADSEPGSVLVFDCGGDNDGVQLIPKVVVDEVLLRVEWIFEKENAERQQLAAGMPVDEVYRVFGVL